MTPHVLVIASLYPSPRQAVAGCFVRDQVLALHRAGVRVGVLAPSQRRLNTWRPGATTQGFDSELDEDVPVLRHETWRWLPGLESLNSRAWIEHGRMLFEQYVDRHGMPDLLHAHRALYAGALAAEIHAEKGVPYVVTEHHALYATNRVTAWQHRLAGEVFAGAAERLAVSPDLGWKLDDQFQCSWRWIPHVVSPRFELRSSPPRQAVASGPFQFLHAGGLYPIKGQEELLTAFASAFRGKRHIELHIAGEGPKRDRLETFARDLHIRKQVAFLGLLNREALAGEMQRADAYVLPSRYETFGITLIEALACGAPVIATSCGGPLCIVNEGNGMLVPPRDHDALASAMKEMVERAHTYDPATLRKDCLDHFGESTVMPQLMDVYARVAKA